VHVRLSELENNFILLQDLLLQLLDFLAIEVHLFSRIVGTESGARLFDSMIEALPGRAGTFLELRDSPLPHSEWSRRELLLE
jgi:hypothetical protein